MIVYRDATLEDLDDIVAIEVSCFERSLQANRQGFTALIKSPTVHFMVAEDARAIVVGNIITFYRSNSKRAYVYSTAVLPAWRRDGIAHRLKLEAHLYAYARGIKEIHSHVASNNTKMIQLNKKLGYEITSKDIDYYGKGKHAYRMVKGKNDD